jgi:protein-disulfide isomerase-like protein with CxxC motif
VERLHRQSTPLNSAGYLKLMSDLGFQPTAVKARMDDPKNPAAARVRRDMALAERLGIHATPTFIVIVEGNPPVSASERGLQSLLHSSTVKLKLARVPAL